MLLSLTLTMNYDNIKYNNLRFKRSAQILSNSYILPRIARRTRRLISVIFSVKSEKSVVNTFKLYSSKWTQLYLNNYLKTDMKTYFLTISLSLLLVVGCNSNYYSEKDFTSIKKIDSHIHLNSDRTIFPDQAVKDNFILITLNVDHGDSADIQKQLDFARLAVKNYPGTVYYAPTFFFDTTEWKYDDWSNKVIEQIKTNLSEGAVSVKIWKNIGMVVRDREGKFIMADNPKLDPVIDYLVKNNITLSGHLGEPLDCWLPLEKMTVSTDSAYFAAHPQYHMYLHKEFPSYEAQITARDKMLEKHPDLQFVAAHLASLEWSVDELAKRLDRFPNISADLAERIVHFQYQSVEDYEKVRNFCIKYQDRILYGTDMSDRGILSPEELIAHYHEIWTDDWKYFTSDEEMASPAFKGKFKALHLPKEVVNKIFYDNAAKWYKLEKSN